jgi:hypothetical protein
MRSMQVIAAGLMSIALAAAAAAQTPQPFPKVSPPRPATPAPESPAPLVASQPGRVPVAPPNAAAPNPNDVPNEASLGVQVYPGAQFLQSFDAGKGQRYYLFGTNTPFTEIVNYYKTVLKQKGDLVYDEPAVHEFDIGKFREETMAFPPSVTVKDYTWGGSAGYMNPTRGAEPPRFKTVIQIVPLPAGDSGR